MNADVVSWSDTRIVILVPQGAGSGAVVGDDPLHQGLVAAGVVGVELDGVHLPCAGGGDPRGLGAEVVAVPGGQDHDPAGRQTGRGPEPDLTPTPEHQDGAARDVSPPDAHG